MGMQLAPKRVLFSDRMFASATSDEQHHGEALYPPRLAAIPALARQGKFLAIGRKTTGMAIADNASGAAAGEALSARLAGSPSPMAVIREGALTAAFVST